MTRAAQKNEELCYLGEFAREQLELNGAVVKSALKEPPDGSVTVTSADGTTLLLDFELSEYFVDTQTDRKSGSPRKQIDGFWENVRTELTPRLAALRLPVDLRVRLNEPIGIRKNQTRQFAEELIQFAQEYCPSDRLRTRHEVFPAERYPLLHNNAEWISLVRLDGLAVIGWHCANLAVASVGVTPAKVASLIRDKSGKAFNWTPGAERCLLIYASGSVVTSRAGPPMAIQPSLEDSGVCAACASSVFDRIYFWERVLGWHERLK
jgi:hypothetical protein